MTELFKRMEAINHLQHYGERDPNLLIYRYLKDKNKFKKANSFLRYRQAWEAARNSRETPEIPLFVTFGLNNSCNLSCTHCYRTYNRDKTEKRFLEFNEICNLISECKEIGVPSIGLGTESELLLYPDIEKVLGHVSKQDFDDVWIFTNGLLLDDKIIDLILNSNFTRLSVSVDAITAGTYKVVRGGRFNKLMSNIFNFLDKREIRKSLLPIFRVTFVKYNLTENEEDDFINFWKKIADEVDVQPLIDVKNVDILSFDTVEEIKCLYPISMLYINWNGDYKPCCSEFAKHLTIGNIKDISIMEAWHSNYLEDLRNQLEHKKPLNKICINCLRSLRSNNAYIPVKGQE